MRLLLTTDTVGGVWTYTKELTEGLLQAGCAVGLASFGARCQPDQRMWCSDVTHRYPKAFQHWETEIALEWMQNNRGAFSEGVAALSEIAASWEPELLHSNQFCFGAFPGKLPRVVVAHSDVLSWAEMCKPEGLEPSDWLDRYTAMVQRGLSEVDAAVAPTRWMLDALRRNFQVPTETQVIANGRSIPQHDDRVRRKMQAVTAGRLWDPAKNVAMLKGVTSMPVVVAGSITSPDQAHSPAAALSEAELMALFCESSVYVATAVYEPFGLAPLEAALCGCVLVANDIATYREIWGDAALFYSTAAELEAHLSALATDEVLSREMRMRARRRAGLYSREAMAAKYLALYKTLLALPERIPGGKEQTLAHAH